MCGLTVNEVLAAHVHIGVDIDVEPFDFAPDERRPLRVPDLLAEGELCQQVAKGAGSLAATAPTLRLVATELEFLSVLREP